MTADISTDLASWSTTASSNQPDYTDTVGPNNLADNLRAIQAGIRLAYASDTIASASTCDLGSKAAFILTVSGTTTITGLGTVSAGIYKVLIFGGVLTLTHNATSLILPAGANISTAAGDVALVVSLGSGNWRCLFYQPKSGGYVAGYSLNTLGTTGSVTLDVSLSENHRVAPTGNVTLSFTNPLPSGQVSVFSVIVDMGATAYTVTWPASVRWPGGSTPALSGASKVDLFSFWSRDGGTTWYGAQTGKAW
jgi:hypothetical protein